ncbi:MAG: SURF1 family protein [Actinomycetia bacterium]|nr:SURF1 family protein [Actinomycetes bacterium]
MAVDPEPEASPAARAEASPAARAEASPAARAEASPAAEASRYRFAFAPRWMALHISVALLLVATVGAGLWQWSRHVDRENTRDLVRERAEGPALTVDQVDLVADSDEWIHIRISETGFYLADQQVFVRGRSHLSAPGSWVLTPLQLDGGGVLVVNRGWVPLIVEPGAPEAEPPSGSVTVDGVLRPTQERGRLGSVDPDGVVLDEVARVDLDRLAEQMDGPLVGAWLDLTAQVPAADTPTPVGEPDFSGGPDHLSYAGQWFIFAATALVGWGILMRRQARIESGEDQRMSQVPIDDAPPVIR